MPSDHACLVSSPQLKGLWGEVVAVRVEDVVVAAAVLVLVVLLEVPVVWRAVLLSVPLEIAGGELAARPDGEAGEAAPPAGGAPARGSPIVTHPAPQWAQHHLAWATDQLSSQPSCTASQEKGPTVAAPPGMSFRR